jgi:four helix bundle protein
MNEQTGRLADGQRITFRQQVLWRKAQDFAAAVAELVVALPRDRATDVIANQVLRAASSIPANIAEGYGRYSQAAYRNHLSIARGSAAEYESWLDLLLRRRYLTEATFQPLLVQLDEVQEPPNSAHEVSRRGKVLCVREEPPNEYQA